MCRRLIVVRGEADSECSKYFFHSIVGAIVGFGAIVGGADAVFWKNVTFIIFSWILSPLCGGAISFFVFTLIRRKIFYTSNPIEAAKKLNPILIFFLVLILSQLMLFKGLKNLHLSISFLEAMGISVGIAAVVALCSFFIIRKIHPAPPQEKKVPPFFKSRFNHRDQQSKKTPIPCTPRL